MATAYNNQNLIDGAADVLLRDNDNPLTANTHGTTACTTTVLTMATSPIAAGFRAGDAIKVTASGAAVRRIASVTATAITLESALPTAPGTAVAIVRCGVVFGFTMEGAQLTTKTSFQERYADQSIDAINTKADKRESRIKTKLQEVFDKSVEAALNLPNSAITTAGGVTTIKVGNSTAVLNTKGYMILGSKEDGSKVTVFASRAVNEGEASFEFAKDKPTMLALDLKLLFDSSQPAGQELYTVEMGPDHNLSFLA